jgi:hypothetical protein
VQQTKLESLVEVCLNVAIGFCVSYAAWPFVAHFYGIPYSPMQNFGITCMFTVLSITRSYIVRRWFNAGIHQAAKNIARALMEKF